MESYRVYLTRYAMRDLRQAFSYITYELREPPAAKKLAERIKTSVMYIRGTVLLIYFSSAIDNIVTNLCDPGYLPDAASLDLLGPVQKRISLPPAHFLQFAN